MSKNKKKVDKSQPKIIGFMQKGDNKKSAVVEKSTKRTNERRAFYTKCVSDQNSCKKQKCVERKNVLVEKVKGCKQTLVKIKEAMDLCETMLKKKDAEIDLLKKSLENKSSNQTNQLYIEFRNKFTDDVLAELRSIDTKFSSDATFIRLCVQYLYRDQRVDNISVTGRSRTKEKKEAMCPQIAKLLTDIFNKRLAAISLTNSERTKRKKRINLLINTAIQNHSKSEESELQELNKKINCTQQN